MSMDWRKYRHGVWRRLGDTVECRATQRTIPVGLVPAENASITINPYFPLDPIFNYEFFIQVKVVGWENKVVVSCPISPSRVDSLVFNGSHVLNIQPARGRKLDLKAGDIITHTLTDFCLLVHRSGFYEFWYDENGKIVGSYCSDL